MCSVLNKIYVQLLKTLVVNGILFWGKRIKPELLQSHILLGILASAQ